MTLRTAILILTLAACSSGPDRASSGPASSGGGNSDWGAAGGGGSDESAGGGGGAWEGCQPGATKGQLAAVPTDAAAGCVETDIPLSIPACTGPEAHDLITYTCLRRVSDGTEFWVASSAVVRPASSEWQPCDHEPDPADPWPEWPRPPAPCITPCGASQQTAPPVSTPAPISTCSPEDMRSMYNCGAADSDRDEGCCRRPACVTDDDCGDGASCAQINPSGLVYSWVGIAPDGSLSCNQAGSIGGAPEMLCVPNDP
ncbi:hypothetical protein [Sorangium sp. So ce341]|uniref:hypothetical protein n=1 Tax=Sorangium sp. So ce341 TaxID=3133302 RepID=UPI003F5F586F